MRPFHALVRLLAPLATVQLAPPASAQEGYRFSPVDQYGISLTANYWTCCARRSGRWTSWSWRTTR